MPPIRRNLKPAKRRCRSKVCLKSAISNRKIKIYSLSGKYAFMSLKRALFFDWSGANSAAKNECAARGSARSSRPRFPLSSTSVFTGGGYMIRR